MIHIQTSKKYQETLMNSSLLQVYALIELHKPRYTIRPVFSYLPTTRQNFQNLIDIKNAWIFKFNSTTNI